VTVQAIPRPQSADAADVVYVLCLMHAAFLLLAGLGEVLLMGGNPLYLGLPIAKMVVLFVFAAKVVSGRRWAMIALIVVQAITIVGFWLQVLAGLLPGLDFTLNLVGLITNVGMPFAVIYLCATLIARVPRLPRRVSRIALAAYPQAPYVPAMYPALYPPQDPYAPAPLVTSAIVTREESR
jgi:hypothetical protein